MRPRPPARRGVATLEVVMCLPVLVGLFALILQIGATAVGESEAVVEARHLAWAKRAESAGAVPFDFGVANSVEGTARKAVRVSPIFAGFPEPGSRHSVLAGAWDYRQVDLDRQPNWKLEIELAPEGGLMQGQNALEELRNFQSVGEGALKNFLENEVGGGEAKNLEKVQKVFEKILAALQGRQQENAGNFQSQREEWTKEIAKGRERVEAIEQQITEKQDRLEEIKKALKKDEAAQKDKLKKDERERLEKERDTIRDETIPELKKELERQKKEVEGKTRALDNVDRYSRPGQTP